MFTHTSEVYLIKVAEGSSVGGKKAFHCANDERVERGEIIFFYLLSSHPEPAIGEEQKVIKL
jgi:hypothetical protein